MIAIFAALSTCLITPKLYSVSNNRAISLSDFQPTGYLKSFSPPKEWQPFLMLRFSPKIGESVMPKHDVIEWIEKCHSICCTICNKQSAPVHVHQF